MLKIVCDIGVLFSLLRGWVGWINGLVIIFDLGCCRILVGFVMAFGEYIVIEV